jgi:hypothetical protein
MAEVLQLASFCADIGYIIKTTVGLLPKYELQQTTTEYPYN